MADLRIDFAGIKSPNPFWLASAPPANSGYQVNKAFEAGWGGAVWKTIGAPVLNVSNRYGAWHYAGQRMLGAAAERIGLDRMLKVNTVKKVTINGHRVVQRGWTYVCKRTKRR